MNFSQRDDIKKNGCNVFNFFRDVMNEFEDRVSVIDCDQIMGVDKADVLDIIQVYFPIFSLR